MANIRIQKEFSYFMTKVIDDLCTARINTLYCTIYFSISRDSLISTYLTQNVENQNKKLANAEDKTWKREPQFTVIERLQTGQKKKKL